MTFFTSSSARHRASASSRLVRGTVLTAAAGAAVLGSVAPAQAYAELPAAPASSSTAPAAATASLTTASTAATPAPAPLDAPEAAPAGESTGTDLAPQSEDVVEIASTASSGGIIGTAMQYEGSGYLYGGTEPGAWDCSGFTQWVYEKQGIDLPRTSQQQWAAGTPTSAPQPGDLVVQNGGAHIGIYLGGGKMISALNPSQGTVVHSVDAMPVDAYVTFR
ncbi:C40 family peptidase [Kocuria flava]|uniref:C40 family peptidase n=1 Tax=Kocuria flava TaxID=446860 RepID=UPI003F19CECA